MTGFTPAWAPAAIIADMSERHSSAGDDPIKQEAGAAAVWMITGWQTKLPRTDNRHRLHSSLQTSGVSSGLTVHRIQPQMSHEMRPNIARCLKVMTNLRAYISPKVYSLLIKLNSSYHNYHATVMSAVTMGNADSVIRCYISLKQYTKTLLYYVWLKCVSIGQIHTY